MAKASDLFQQSDLAVWGLVAIAAGGLAVVSANISALVPPDALAGLHRTRLASPSVEQLRLQVADLREQSRTLQDRNTELTDRLDLEQQRASEVIRRLGALEVSIPNLLEALPPGAEIDRSNLTAAIDNPGDSFEADGGSVTVRQQPLAGAVALPPIEQPLPAPVTTASSLPAFAVAVGPAITAPEAAEAWRDLSLKLGPLLLGLSPRLADAADGTTRLVAGPLETEADATRLCQRLEPVAISCQPTSYGGAELSL